MLMYSFFDLSQRLTFMVALTSKKVGYNLYSFVVQPLCNAQATLYVSAASMTSSS